MELEPCHGGNPQMLPQGIAAASLLDLATGINPWAWPIDAALLSSLQTLPYDSPSLRDAAAQYFDIDGSRILPTAGSQSAIQMLPQSIAVGRVLMAAPAYEEHAYRWAQAGHEVRHFPDQSPDGVAGMLENQGISHLVLVSPNNPTGTRYSNAQLLAWREQLPPEGLMVVDQAYADAEAETASVAELVKANIIVLRSTGKFFGLPGLRLGFVLAAPAVLDNLATMQGPWAVNSLAQVAGAAMLADTEWQQAMRDKLHRVSARQSAALASALSGQYDSLHRSPLFNTLKMPVDRALQIQQLAYHHDLFLRVYQWQGSGYLRWGLAAQETRFNAALSGLANALSDQICQEQNRAVIG